LCKSPNETVLAACSQQDVPHISERPIMAGPVMDWPPVQGVSLPLAWNMLG